MTAQRARTLTRPRSNNEPDRKTDWRESAACDGMDVELWFAETGGATRFDKAREVCVTCPVAAACLRDGLAEEGGPSKSRYGIRGGLTREQRAILAGSPNDTTDCGPDIGTANGVTRHHANHAKQLCPACHWYNLANPQPETADSPRRDRTRPPIRHATKGGYDQHRRRGEDPCDECSDARREYDRSRYSTPETREARATYLRERRAARRAS